MARRKRAYPDLNAWVDAQPSRAEAARTLGISEGYLSMLLSGKRGAKMTLERAMKLAARANIPVESLLKIYAA